MDDGAAPGLPDDGLSAQAEVASTQISGTKFDFTQVILFALRRRGQRANLSVGTCSKLA
jgi:hypothetical protein